MRILFLGDVVGNTGCSKVKNNLLEQKKIHKIDFVIINAENADDSGVGLTKEICHDFYNWVNTSTANEPKYNPERDSFDPLKVKEGRSELIEQLDDFVDQYQLKIKYQERRNTNAHT